MAIKSVISAGTKQALLAGTIVTIGGGNAVKLSPDTAEFLGATVGSYCFIAPDDENSALFYIAVSDKATNAANERGYKLGISGEKVEGNATGKQLQFTSGALNGMMAVEGYTYEVAKEEGFEHNGLTFYPLNVQESREDYNARVAAREEAKQEAVNAQEEEAPKKGRKSAE